LNYSRSLQSDAVFYKRVREGDSADVKERDIWLGLATLRAQSGYALLISANRSLTEIGRKRISTALFSLLVRHNIICDKDRAKFETTVFSAAKAISDGGGEDAALALLRALSPSDREVRQSFSTLNFRGSQNSSAQIILRALEYELRVTDELVIATPDRVHLEHIYAQRPAPADRLANHDEYVGRIGNLTLLDHRLNQEAQNLGFIAKKDRFYIHSGIYLTRELLDDNAWTPREIDARQQHLCDLAIQVWPQDLIPA
jgi:hypothetical protein